jgi:hypothetical protein
MEAGRRITSQKRLAPNQRVSGAVGDFIPGPSKRRRRRQLFGHVIRAVGERCYLVGFDDGQEKECSSNILKVESVSASLLPDIPVPARDVLRDVSAAEEAAGTLDVLDNEKVEDMPDIRPEEEYAEAAEKEDNSLDMDAVEVPSEGGEVNEDTAPNNNAEALQQNGEIAIPESTAEQNIHEPNGRMPGQLPTEASATVKDYYSIKKAAKEKIAALVGTEVTVTSRKNCSLTWNLLIATHHQ